jgi:uncharacterized protein YdeI (YjbR/CyaY-like superfamily)
VEEPSYFATPDDLRAWLDEHHESERELWVGFYKKGSGRPSVTWPEAVDEALCVGWIDGVRKGVDDESYKIRFTPRAKTSKWSKVNVARVAELTKLGRMRPAGVAAFEARGHVPAAASHEQENVQLDPEQERRFRANGKAWKYFQGRPPWYRKAATWWVTSAKREDTRERRLTTLIEDSEQERTVPPLTRPADSG